MPASFLHGVETIEIEKGARTIKTVKTAVVGLVGTAPLEDVDTDLSHTKSNSDQMDDYIKYSDVSPEVAQRVKNRISSYIERI